MITKLKRFLDKLLIKNSHSASAVTVYFKLSHIGHFFVSVKKKVCEETKIIGVSPR